MMRKIFKGAVFGIISLVMVISFQTNSFAQEKIIKEMVIQVDARMIALPGNEAAKVPITAARFRSSELRQLNEQYNAVRIERIFKLKKEEKKAPLDIKGVKEDKKTVKESQEEIVNIANIFTQEIKKEMLAKGEKVIELDNVFLIQFEFEEDVNMTGIVSAYQDIPGVISAQSIIRTN
ncbi:MAG: hypothetical protein ABIG64_04895 [Candidatus Omnitrophota bacterium]